MHFQKIYLETRDEVIKLMWRYIKDDDPQDPKTK